MRIKQVYFFLLLLFFSVAANAQGIDSLLSLYNSKVPQEKAYVHFDNDLYEPGQTIWYKAYLQKGNEPSDLSRIFYIDWFDENGKFISRVVAPIVGSTASGNFTIPLNYKSSRLQVVAYTKWMLNVDSAFLFRQTIKVAQLTVSEVSVSTRPIVSLAFYPEGGFMIGNVTGTVAFKAQDPSGMPVNIEGVITDNSGREITNFTSVHNGMGKISLTPLPGELYKAEWTDNFGVKRYTPLPVPQTEGVALSVSNDNTDNIFFSIERTATAGDQFRKGTIVAQMNQRLVFRAGIDLAEKAKLRASIPVGDLPSGILQVTVFDAQHKPVAERVVFINNNNFQLNAEIQFDTLNLQKRGKNVYTVNLPDSISASVSVSVTDVNAGKDSATNIVAHFLLSGVRGYIHDSYYYFRSPSARKKEALDLVMLTNGWRRILWDHVWAGKTPLIRYPADTGYLSISGRIDSMRTRKIQRAETVNMILEGKNTFRQYYFIRLQPDGRFQENNLILFDTTKIYYQLNKSTQQLGRRISIGNSFLPFDITKKVAPLFSVLTDTLPLSRIRYIANEQQQLDSLKNKTTLQEVIVTTKFKTRLEQLDEKYASGFFAGHSRLIHEYNLIDDTLGKTHAKFSEYLRNKVTGYSEGIHGVSVNGNPASFSLDGVRGMGMDELRTLSVGQIAYVKVFIAPGAGKPAPVIVIYLKKGTDIHINNEGMEYVLMEGYTPVKEFYVPGSHEQAMNGTPDLRRTVYWNPNILMDKNNRSKQVIFYNNDISTSLQIVLEGMSADGRLIHFSKLLR